MKSLRRIAVALQARPVIALYAFIAGVVVAGGLAYGSIPAANGIITGCYNNKTGALRVIDISKAKCASGTETQLKWNQKGAPPGQSGLTCSDELRIKDAAPAFNLSAACTPPTTTPPATTSTSTTTTTTPPTTTTTFDGSTTTSSSVTTTSSPTTTTGPTTTTPSTAASGIG